LSHGTSKFVQTLSLFFFFIWNIATEALDPLQIVQEVEYLSLPSVLGGRWLRLLFFRVPWLESTEDHL
jgi:hypothetical protein